MLASLTQLLNHYAHRIGITLQPHPKGAQITIAIMPCPNKVKDEHLRQQLIAPIVLAGDNDTLNTQLLKLNDSLTTAKDNVSLQQSVDSYLASVSSATAKTSDKPPKAATQKPATDDDKGSKETPPASVKQPADNQLDDFFA